MLYIGYILIFIGLVFSLISAIGCLRMNDAYTKLHAAGVADACGIPIALLGIIMTQGINMVSAKILLLILLILVISPLSTHAIIRAAGYRDKLFNNTKK